MKDFWKLVYRVFRSIKESSIAIILVFATPYLWGIPSLTRCGVVASCERTVILLLKPYLNAMFRHIPFGLKYTVIAIVKNTGRQNCVGMALYDSFHQVM
ncbi:hypothetical protein SAMN05216428_1079 [Nitrosospira sp. Nsp11]|nr:hypothetical protein SAMN05216428_1079 [Nitrosospira sp. Nsp11]